MLQENNMSNASNVNMSKLTEGETGQSIATCLVSVPVVITGVANEVSWSLNIAGIPDDDREAIVAGLIRQGALIITQRGGSGKDLASRKAVVVSAIKKLQDGTYPFGGGGPKGPRITPEQDAWIEWLKADGESKISKKTLRQVQLERCAEALIKKGKATKENALDLAEQEVDAWVAFMEEKRPTLASLIAAKGIVQEEVEEEY
jgi:hypothetical protein